MKQRMRHVFVLALATCGVVISACGDDDSSGPNDNGGSAGASGSKTGGSSAGGSTSKAGSNNGGKAGNATAGTSANAGAGGAADGGMSGAGDGGAGGNSAGAGGSGGDAGGAGGAGEPALVYACGSANQFQKTCSAWVAADCPDATICADCVAALTADREGFQNDPPCDTCDAKYDAFYQCQIDAFESNNLAAGVECVEGFGADATLDCYPLLDEAIACQGYVGSDQDPKPCPATWPPQ